MNNDRARTSNRVCRILPTVLSLTLPTALLLWSATLQAQPETRSHRPLPLPEGESASPEQHRQMLRQLKSLMSSAAAETQTPDSQNPLSQLNPEQMDLLLNAARKFAENFPDAIPKDLRPPDMNGISGDDVSRALQDPKMRETVKRLLEQYHQNRTLPRNSDSGDPLRLPSPDRSTNPRSQPEEDRADQTRTGPPGPESNRPSTPTKTQDNVERKPPSAASTTAPPRGARQTKTDRTRPKAAPDQTPSPTRRQPESQDSSGNQDLAAEPDQQKPFDPADDSGQNLKPGDSAVSPVSPDATQPKNPRGQLKTNDSLPSGSPTSRSNKNFDNSPSSGTAPQTDGGREARPPAEFEQQFNKAVMDWLRNNPAPSGANSERATGSRSPQSQPQSADSERQSNAASSATPGTPMSGDLRESMRKQLERTKKSLDGMRPGGPTQNPAAPVQNNSPQLTQTPKSPITDGLDIRRELERRGFGPTLQKIIEQASQDAAPPNSGERGTSPQSAEAASASANPNIQPTEGMTDSVIRMLDGFGKDLKKMTDKSPSDPAGTREGIGTTERAGESPDTGASGTGSSARGSNRTSRPQRQERAPSRISRSPSSSGSDGNSVLDRIGKAASEFLRDVATAPPSTPSGAGRSMTSTGGGARAATPGPGAISGPMIAAVFGMMALMIAAAAVLLLARKKLRPLSATREWSAGGGIVPPSGIRTRSDLIRAFHHFVLQPMSLVQSWWTHREAAIHIARRAPERQAAIETLTGLYERARYLPEDQELTPEQFRAAQLALEQCEACSA